MTDQPQAKSEGRSPIRRVSPRRLALSRFFSNRLAVVGLFCLVVLAMSALFAPALTPYDPDIVDLSQIRQPPSAEHWLGTDLVGRDVLSRVLHAGRVSLLVGGVAALAASIVGLTLGAVAGSLGGALDGLIMRVTDTALSFPTLIVVIVFAGIFGPGLTTLVVAIAFLEWPTAARMVRGQFLSLKEQEFVEAARAIGLGELRIAVRHLVPAVLAQLAVIATLVAAYAILVEAALSFLGLGVQPPQASWGNMMNDSRNLTVLREMPWLWIPPGVAIAITVFSINFLGDGLRDVVGSS